MGELTKLETETVRNFTLETLLKQIEEKKELETKKYFDALASNSIEKVSENNSNPIEVIFAKNLKESLLKF